MNELLVKPSGRQGPLHDICPADAGWHYVGFAVHEMADRECLSSKGTDDEICFVLLSGAAHITAGTSDFGTLSFSKPNRPFCSSVTCILLPSLTGATKSM